MRAGVLALAMSVVIVSMATKHASPVYGDDVSLDPARGIELLSKELRLSKEVAEALDQVRMECNNANYKAAADYIERRFFDDALAGKHTDDDEQAIFGAYFLLNSKGVREFYWATKKNFGAREIADLPGEVLRAIVRADEELNFLDGLASKIECARKIGAKGPAVRGVWMSTVWANRELLNDEDYRQLVRRAKTALGIRRLNGEEEVSP